MIRPLILSGLKRWEMKLGVSVEYLRHICRTSLRLFFKFLKFSSFAQHRRVVPPGPYFVASIVATRLEDCGTCVQIAVTLARQEGVDAEHLRHVLDSRPDQLPEELAEAYHFADSVLSGSPEQETWRERIRARYGDEGLIEMAYGLAASRVFPTVKRALGYAQSCSLVPVKV